MSLRYSRGLSGGGYKIRTSILNNLEVSKLKHLIMLPLNGMEPTNLHNYLEFFYLKLNLFV